MSLARWYEAELAALKASDGGWHYDDSVALEKLAISLRRHGQLRAVVVRHAANGELEIVDGVRLVQAMQALDWTRCMVADIGAVDRMAARQLALDLELRFEVDYAKLAFAVADMLEAGAVPEGLAAASPFSAERIGHFRTLAVFDWNQFSGAPEGQTALSWGDEPEAAAAVLPEPDLAPTEALDVLPEVFEMEPEPAPAPVAPPPLLPPGPDLSGMAAAIPPRPLTRPLPEAPEPQLVVPDGKRKHKPEPQLGLF